MKPASTLLIAVSVINTMPFSCLGQSELLRNDTNSSYKLNERFRIEVAMQGLIPTTNSIVGSGTDEISFITKSDTRINTSFSPAISVLFTTYNKYISKHKLWTLNLSVGATVQSVFWETNGTYNSYCYSCPTPNEIIGSGSNRVQHYEVGVFVDNILFFSKESKKLNLQIGINLQTGYRFWGHDIENRVINTQDTSITISRNSSWTSTQQISAFAEDYTFAGWLFQNCSAQLILGLQPKILRGIYALLRLPLQPAPVNYGVYQENKVMSYGFSFAVGYQFQNAKSQ